jgi:hypothetical protein
MPRRQYLLHAFKPACSSFFASPIQDVLPTFTVPRHRESLALGPRHPSVIRTTAPQAIRKLKGSSIREMSRLTWLVFIDPLFDGFVSVRREASLHRVHAV